MIKILKATYHQSYIIKLDFSDNSFSNYDFSYLLERNTSLTKSLEDIGYFKEFFLELGAICWKNGLELSPESLHNQANDRNILIYNEEVA